MKINLKKISVYAAETAKGRILLEEVSRWNGLIEVRDPQGQKLILMPKPEGEMARFFRQNLPDFLADGVALDEFLVLAGTSELIEQIEKLRAAA